MACWVIESFIVKLNFLVLFKYMLLTCLSNMKADFASVRVLKNQTLVL